MGSIYIYGMKHILLFGAGKSATVLIDYLKTVAATHEWHVVVADSNLQAVENKVGKSDWVTAVQADITNEAERKKLVQDARVVISMMPPHLHYLIALDCIAFEKHLLTATYVDEKIKQLSQEIADKQLLFLCEMGLDPGIDHMSAMQLIHAIQAANGTVISFKSHCGGLVAPESDDNPWHYKISWNPRNIVLAGKAGATYKVNNEVVNTQYGHLFDANNTVSVYGDGTYAYYPNRDSLSYVPLYALETAATFVRTTLRHPEFCLGWKHIVDLQLTDETVFYETDGLCVSDFFKLHFERFNLNTAFDKLVTGDGILLNQFTFLGVFDDATLIDKGLQSAADVLQFILERKLVLQQEDKDLIVMLHELEYMIADKKHSIASSLVVKGEDSLRTAMAKTVGLPLGIAAKLILEGKLTITGLHIPIVEAIYKPVLKELEEHGIQFKETVVA